MLLNNRLNQIQSQIESYLEEIAKLQAQVTTLQTHAQEVQTVEQAAESALSQISTALSMLSAVCPDEIATFKAAVDAKFREPVLELTAGVDNIETPVDQPPAAPNPETETDTTTIEASAVTVIEEDFPTTELEVDVNTTVDTADTNGNGNGHHLVGYVDRLLEYEDLRKCDKHTLTKFAKQYGLEGKTKNDLAQALAGMIASSEMEAAISTNDRV